MICKRKMLLDGKYIKLEKKQIKPILDLLYKKGYNWPSGGNNEISVELYEKYDFIYVYSHSISTSYLQYSDIELNFSVVFFDIVKFLRENKLKRILK